MSRPVRAEINLAHVRHNFALANQLAAPGQNVAVVKANGYGHGAVAVAKALGDIAPAFAVACIEEALELRRAGIQTPVLLLEGAFSAEEIEVAQRENFWLMVNNPVQVNMLQQAELASSENVSLIKVWLKVDTGMHRLGFEPGELTGVYRQLKSCSVVAEEIVVVTHFACADDVNNPKTSDQLALFNKAYQSLRDNNADTETIPVSLANSAALLAWPETNADWSRPGFMLYGNSPLLAEHEDAKKLKQAMTMKSEVIAVRTISAGESVGYGAQWSATKTSKIATVAMGYGDGYPCNAKVGTPVLINGQRCPLVGRVSMDMLTVDVTQLNQVAIGDEVILWGEDLTCNEIASYANTIGYEIMTRIPARVPRIYST